MTYDCGLYTCLECGRHRVKLSIEYILSVCMASLFFASLFFANLFYYSLIFAAIHESHYNFGTIYEFHCTILTNFYLYLQYFQ